MSFTKDKDESGGYDTLSANYLFSVKLDEGDAAKEGCTFTTGLAMD